MVADSGESGSKHIYLMNIGNTLQYDLGNIEASLELYSDSLEINSEYGLNHFNQGNALASLGKKSMAVLAYHQAISLQPDPLISFVARQCKEKRSICPTDVFGKLRFKCGDEVLCNVGAWSAGTVIDLWYSEYGLSMDWPGDRISPYQVQLENGDLICAPIDNDFVIRAKKTKTKTEAAAAPPPPPSAMSEVGDE